MANPEAVDDANGEWIELYNASAAAINLSGWTMSDHGSDSIVLSAAGPLFIAAGDYVVIARGNNPVANPNWSFSVSWTLDDDEDEIVLSDENGAEVFSFAYASGPGPHGQDFVVPGVSSWLDRNYVGDANQAANPANWCANPNAVAPLGGGSPGSTAGDRGTPGIVNPGC